MKLVILAGGLGTRISEETQNLPKPMIEIGGKPIIWHIMKYYSFFGVNEFIICCGFKGYKIKEYFNNYFLHQSNVTFDMADNTMQVHKKNAEPWKISLIDTGLDTMTGGRIKKIVNYLNDNEPFYMTYGDGLSNVDINKATKLYLKFNKIALVTAVRQPSRFGIIKIKDNIVTNFEEKPFNNKNERINGGFFILNKKIIVNLQTEERIGIIICDHQARDLLTCVDRAIVLSNGKIIAEGSPKEIINNTIYNTRMNKDILENSLNRALNGGSAGFIAMTGNVISMMVPSTTSFQSRW